MTNEEAVKMLRTMQRTVYLGNRKFEDAIECAIKALSEPLQPWEVLAAQSVLSQPEPHWIPVKDQLPELDEWVLVSSEGGVIADSMVIRNGERIWYTSGDILEDDHWMPLPDPWKGE